MRPRIPLCGLTAVAAVLLVACGGTASTAKPGGSSLVLSPSPSEPFAVVAHVFLPPGASGSHGRVPLIVLVPGGMWLSADPSGFGELAQRLAADGSAVVTTTYRTQAEGATFPLPVEDVVCAVNESAKRVGKSGLKVGPVVVVGHSAGAPLAALAALVGDRYQASCPSPHVSVDGLVGLAGPYDLVALADLARALFGSSPADDPDTWKAASPINQVAKRPDLPVLLLHGQADDNLPPSTSKEFAGALEGAGHAVTLDLLPAVDHFQVYRVAVAAQPIEDFVTTLDSAG